MRARTGKGGWRCRLGTLIAAGVMAIAGLAGAPAATAAIGPGTAVPTSCSVPSGTGTTFASGGLTRTFTIQLPPGPVGPSTPMMISLHGGLGSAALQQQVTGFSDTPAATAVAGLSAMGMQRGFIAVFPQARDTPPNTVWNANPTSPDVTFVAELTSYLHARGCSSPAVTTVNGFSLGAMLTARLLCVRPDLFAGGAMVAGVLAPTSGCRIPRALKVVTMHGVLDTSVPFDGTLATSLMALVGPDAVSPVDRVAITKKWAAAKDCPSPGWTTTGINNVTDFGCPSSTTMAVWAPNQPHSWDYPGVNTSELIWAVMRPDRPCTVAPSTTSDPAIARAIEARLASDIAFRIDFVRNMNNQMTCNPALRQTVINAINAEIKRDPNGMVAQQIAFAIREVARTGR